MPNGFCRILFVRAGQMIYS